MVLYEFPRMNPRSYPDHFFPFHPSQAMDGLDFLTALPAMHAHCRPSDQCKHTESKKEEPATEHQPTAVDELFWNMVQPMFNQRHQANKDDDKKGETSAESKNEGAEADFQQMFQQIMRSLLGEHAKSEESEKTKVEEGKQSSKCGQADMQHLFHQMMQPWMDVCLSHQNTESDQKEKAKGDGDGEDGKKSDEKSPADLHEFFRQMMHHWLHAHHHGKKTGEEKTCDHETSAHPHELLRHMMHSHGHGHDAKSDEQTQAKTGTEEKMSCEHDTTVNPHEMFHHMMHPWFDAHSAHRCRPSKTASKNSSKKENAKGGQEKPQFTNAEQQSVLKNEVQSPVENRGFVTSLNVNGFAPQEIKVTLVDGVLKVEGKREKQDDEGFESQQFVRRVKLPDNIDIDGIKSTFKEGQLAIEAPLKKMEDKKSKIVPIQMEQD